MTNKFFSKAILISGCAFENLSNVYVLSLYYNNATTSAQSFEQFNTNTSKCLAYAANDFATLQVRIGYFGSCLVLEGVKSLSTSLVCSKSLDTLASSVRDTDVDPLNLLEAAKEFYDSSIFSGLIFTSIALSFACCLLLLTYRSWFEEVDSAASVGSYVSRSTVPKPFDSRHFSTAALVCLALSSLFSFISALWQHLSAAATVSMVKVFGYGYARGRIGTTAMVLGWGGAALTSIVMVALLLVIFFMRFVESQG